MLARIGTRRQAKNAPSPQVAGPVDSSRFAVRLKTRARSVAWHLRDAHHHAGATKPRNPRAKSCGAGNNRQSSPGLPTDTPGILDRLIDPSARRSWRGQASQSSPAPDFHGAHVAPPLGNPFPAGAAFPFLFR